MTADGAAAPANGWVYLDLDRTLTTDSTEPTVAKALWRSGWCSAGQLALVGWHYVRYRLHMIPEIHEVKRHVIRHLLKGKPVAEVEAVVAACFRDQLLPTVRPALVDEIDRHRRNGLKVALLTSTLDLIARHFRDHFGYDAMIAAELEKADGVFTGEIVNGFPYGEAKLALARRHAAAVGVDLVDCYAYGDRFEDRFLLDRVGHPVAVAPDRKLGRVASLQGWPVFGSAL